MNRLYGISVTGSDNSTVITAQGFLTNQYLGSTVDCRGNIFNGILVYPKGKTDLTYEWVAKISNTSIAISPGSNINLNYCTKMTNEEISINAAALKTEWLKLNILAQFYKMPLKRQLLLLPTMGRVFWTKPACAEYTLKISL